MNTGVNLAGIPICFAVDGLSILFLAMAVVLWILVFVATLGYMSHDERKKSFYLYYVIVLGSMAGIFCSGNLVTMYLFYEIMTLTALPLIIHYRKRADVAAGMKYLYYSCAGAVLGLFGIIFLYTQYGYDGICWENGGNIGLASGSPLAYVVVLLMICGFCVKAGMFPMHAWLPAAHPKAPAPASAVLSGVITKAGIFCVIRIVYYVIGFQNIKGTWVQYTWIVLALISIFMGSVMAYKTRELKMRLAYSSVSQLSYILFGLALCHPAAFAGALLHVLAHGFIKNQLFCTAGLMIHETGCADVDSFSGIGRKMPLTMIGFLIASLALVGVPPLSGFASKWYLLKGCLDSEISVVWWLGAVILLISALLTAWYLFPIVIQAFLPGDSCDMERLRNVREEKLSVVALLFMSAVTIVIGVFSSDIFDGLSVIIETVF